jgi:hypothetical protein
MAQQIAMKVSYQENKFVSAAVCAPQSQQRGEPGDGNHLGKE